MIDFKELDNFEVFEDLCESILKKEGLSVRRLGRGPGQLGKDIIVKEYVKGPLGRHQENKWLVECKFTKNIGNINENDIFNVYDRVISQNAFGYMLCTNARMAVNLEKTLNNLASKIGIIIWSTQILSEKILLHHDIFRTFFPISHQKWLKENRTIYLGLTLKLKTPLVHILNNIQLLQKAPRGVINPAMESLILNNLSEATLSLINEIDANQKLIVN